MKVEKELLLLTWCVCALGEMRVEWAGAGEGWGLFSLPSVLSEFGTVPCLQLTFKKYMLNE